MQQKKDSLNNFFFTFNRFFISTRVELVQPTTLSQLNYVLQYFFLHNN